MMEEETGKRSSKNHASTPRTSLLAISIPAPALTAFGCGFFLVEHVLRLDVHVEDVGGVAVELEVWKERASVHGR